MQIISNLSEWKSCRQNLANKTIGLVPTMGNLHAGHTSLLKRAREENEVIVLTIYVNPTQFNDPQDFERYPRTHEADIALAESVGVDFVLMPEKADLYPDDYTFRVTETILSQPLEGLYRPGHFTGMLTIVLKLLLLVSPDQAYFGEKDYQQLQLIRGLVQAFLLNITIKACPTLREPSGLPLSSRNNLLNPEEKGLAEYFAEVFADTTLSCDEVKRRLLQANIEVEYIEDQADRRFAAVKVGRIRLIDNRVR